MPTIMNQGAEALSRSGSISDLAAQLGVNPRTISGWRSGAKLPNDASRANIQRVAGVDRRLWDLRVAAPQAPKAAPRVRAPEPHWWVPQHTPWLTYGHPMAALAVRRLALAGLASAAGDDGLDALDNEVEELSRRHPALAAACEAAELALGAALALEAPDDENAAKFLRFHGKGGQAHVAA